MKSEFFSHSLELKSIDIVIQLSNNEQSDYNLHLSLHFAR